MPVGIGRGGGDAANETGHEPEVAGRPRSQPAKGGREGESREGRERIGGEERESWFPKMETLKPDITPK